MSIFFCYNNTLRTSLLWLLVLSLLNSATSQTCTVTGAWAQQISGNSVVCEGSDACRGANISGCDTVTCGERDCTEATITNSGAVICQGESACRQANIGTASSPVTSVTCQGKDWACYQATIFANVTVVCEDNSGEGLVKKFGICGFANLETPCLQCIGTNHGCGSAEACKLSGQPCPEYRYGGTSCEAACPAGETCKMNETLPTGEKASGGYRIAWGHFLGCAMAGLASWILS